MKTLFRFFCLSALSLLLCQCSPNKDSYLKDFEKFMTKTEKNITTITDDEWKTTLATYGKYIGEDYKKYEQELSDNDKIKIAFLKDKFSSLVFKREAEKFKQLMK